MPEDRAVSVRRHMRRALLLVLAALPAAAQTPVDGARLSKQMRMAIDLYKRGDDLAAMDRFMEVLVKGDPAERTIANDYLNRITHRMAIGSKLENAPPAPEPEPAPPGAPGGPETGVAPRAPVETVTPAAAPGPAVKVEGEGAPPEGTTPSDREEPSPARSQGGPSEDRKVMKEEIDAKIRARTRDALGHLRRWEEIQVRMANSRLPRAIGFKSSLLFDEGMRFKRDAGRVIDALADLVFSLGATQVVILPEGALFNEAKILDMRRTMAVSAQLMKAGVSPARLRVNLLNSQVDVPRDLHDWRGVLVVFQYNQPLNLASDSDVGAEGGPPISLGVSPASLDPRDNEGVIVELSVMEPPAGLMSWRFQLLAPAARPEADMVSLQEVKGSAPVFHQIYWNGRKRYFGDPLPPGRYECVLSATDNRNRTARSRAWIEVKGVPPPAAAAPLVAQAAQTTQATLDQRPVVGEEDELNPSGKPSSKKGAKGAKRSSKTRSRKGKAARVKRKPSTGLAVKEIKAAPAAPDPGAAPSAPDAGEPPSAPDAGAPPAPKGAPGGAKPAEKALDDAAPRAQAVNYQVLFQKGTTNITKEGEGILARVADTMHYYPLDNIHLVGYAYNGEPDAAALATRRAEFVSKLLVERHGMKAEHIRADTKVVDFETFKVEIYIVEGQQ